MASPPLDIVYSRLLEHYGPQHWWPAESPYEVMVGAILTQNTSWTQVEKAIANLKRAGVLSPAGIANLPAEELQTLIRPSGFFRQKGERLQTLTALLLDAFLGDPARLCSGDLDQARARLLALHGIGPETADSILLYAGGRPSFVVDAYTLRLLTRLAVVHGNEGYETIRRRFMDSLPSDSGLFNEYHALIVVHAKQTCRKRQPRCSTCPLASLCPAFVSATP